MEPQLEKNDKPAITRHALMNKLTCAVIAPKHWEQIHQSRMSRRQVLEGMQIDLVMPISVKKGTDMKRVLEKCWTEETPTLQELQNLFHFLWQHTRTNMGMSQEDNAADAGDPIFEKLALLHRHVYMLLPGYEEGFVIERKGESVQEASFVKALWTGCSRVAAYMRSQPSVASRSEEKKDHAAAEDAKLAAHDEPPLVQQRQSNLTQSESGEKPSRPQQAQAQVINYPEVFRREWTEFETRKLYQLLVIEDEPLPHVVESFGFLIGHKTKTVGKGFLFRLVSVRFRDGYRPYIIISAPHVVSGKLSAPADKACNTVAQHIFSWYWEKCFHPSAVPWSLKTELQNLERPHSKEVSQFSLPQQLCDFYCVRADPIFLYAKFSRIRKHTPLTRFDEILVKV